MGFSQIIKSKNYSAFHADLDVKKLKLDKNKMNMGFLKRGLQRAVKNNKKLLGDEALYFKFYLFKILNLS